MYIFSDFSSPIVLLQALATVGHRDDNHFKWWGTNVFKVW